MGFSAADYAVLAAYLIGITAFGSRFRSSHRSVRDYFLGSRQTSWVVISLSIVATETSTLTLIGVPALAYGQFAGPELGGSFTYLQVVAGYIVARFVISALFIPAYFQGEMLTAYELLNRRFGSQAKHFAASLFLVMRALAEGVRVFAASLVLAAVLGASVPGLPNLWLWSIVIVGLLTLNVTVPFTFWAGLIGGCFLTMASHGTDQLLVQRLLTCRNQRESQVALILSGFVVFAQFVLFLTIGMMLHAYYATHPLPPMASNDEIFPAFIVRSLPHGIAGLVIAAIFAAAMSNLSGSLNSLASTTVLDFYQPLAGRQMSDAQLLTLSRWLTAAWGVVLIAIAILARGWGSVFTVGLTIASIVYGPMLGAFLLGVLTRSATQTGVMAGIGVSLVAMIAVRVVTPLAWTWYVLVGSAICMAVGLGLSRVNR